MTLAEKIKEARKQAGISQEQLAEKICVSRAAVAKWETGKGIPDVENLKALSRFLNVSIDYLLDDGEGAEIFVTHEAVNLDDYQKTGKCRCKEDAVVLEKFAGAEVIKPLIRKRKLTAFEHVIDFLTTPGAIDVVDSANDMSEYYFVEKNGRQYLVNVTKEAIITTELTRKITENKFVIGKNKFIKVAYEIR